MSDLFQIERIGTKIAWKIGQKEKIVELYQSGVSIHKIKELFGTLHYNTIKKILNNYSIPLRTKAQSHYQDKRDETLFTNIDTEEKAYWLGFLCGDGCIHGNYIRIILQAKDIQHLYKFRDFIGANSVAIREQNGYVVFSVGIKQIAQDLKRHGCVERKSLILTPPVTLPNKLYLDWLRGLWDADGGISYNKKSNRWQCYLTSTKEVCKFFIDTLNINTKPFLENRCEHTYRVHFNGRLNVMDKLNQLYHNDNATIFLNRKHEMYQKLLSTLQQ